MFAVKPVIADPVKSIVVLVISIVVAPKLTFPPISTVNTLSTNDVDTLIPQFLSKIKRPLQQIVLNLPSGI